MMFAHLDLWNCMLCLAYSFIWNMAVGSCGCYLAMLLLHFMHTRATRTLLITSLPTKQCLLGLPPLHVFASERQRRSAMQTLIAAIAAVRRPNARQQCICTGFARSTAAQCTQHAAVLQTAPEYSCHAIDHVKSGAAARTNLHQVQCHGCCTAAGTLASPATVCTQLGRLRSCTARSQLSPPLAAAVTTCCACRRCSYVYAIDGRGRVFTDAFGLTGKLADAGVDTKAVEVNRVFPRARW
ncbi:hypothetical protein COO60DRAFT_439830 [Scenedesmus sp. NREL 46B-D3]|nr:hypothetical protein COO60DRAFT_439830 [Scenedesmus sp. NREL 46B-D3]